VKESLAEVLDLTKLILMWQLSISIFSLLNKLAGSRLTRFTFPSQIPSGTNEVEPAAKDMGKIIKLRTRTHPVRKRFFFITGLPSKKFRIWLKPCFPIKWKSATKLSDVRHAALANKVSKEIFLGLFWRLPAYVFWDNHCAATVGTPLHGGDMSPSPFSANHGPYCLCIGERVFWGDHGLTRG
jgi:hypothetical protein